jgi:hypothetical protein
MTTSDDLPPTIAGIVEFLAMMAKGYNNHLKWNEQDMFKADLMNVRHRWRSVDIAAFRSKCLSEGMRTEDTQLLVDWLAKAQSGRRLIPSKSYRGFAFNPVPEAPKFDEIKTRAW